MATDGGYIKHLNDHRMEHSVSKFTQSNKAGWDGLAETHYRNYHTDIKLYWPLMVVTSITLTIIEWGI